MAAILFPVFARARENARRSSCQSNLKQLGLGVLQYTQDYDETFPILYNDNSRTGIFKTGLPWGEVNDFNWTDRIFPYVKSADVFHCPSLSQGITSPGSAYSHYGMNIYLTKYCNSDLASADQNTAFKISAVTSASVKVLMTDHRLGKELDPNYAGAWALATNWTYLFNYVTFPSASLWASCNVSLGCLTAPAAPRHLEGTNVSYMDGHVKWVKIGTDAAGVDSNSTWGTISDYGNSNDFRTNWDLPGNAKAMTAWAPHR